MLRRILVPTDGSDFSAQVLPIVRALATAHGAEVIFARVVDDTSGIHHLSDEPVPPEITVEMMEALESEAREELAQLAGQFEAESLPVRVALLHGSVASALLNYAIEVEPDLVVMATHSRTGLARLVFGSVADRMVLEGTAPVLLFGPAATLPTTLDSALAPLDGSSLAEEALLLVETLAGRPLRTVRLLRAVASERERGDAAAYLRGAAAALSAGGLEVEVEVRVDAPGHAIEAAAPAVDVVVMATHGRGGLDRLRHGSIAQETAGRVTRPVIVTRPTLRKVSGDVTQFLANVRLFHELNTQQLNSLASVAQQRSYSDGEVIVRERDLGVGLFVIRTGRAEVLERRNDKDERLRVMGPGEVFGEIAILERTARTATVQAIEPTTCLVISGLTLATILDETPEAKAQFQATIADRLGMGTPEPAGKGPD